MATTMPVELSTMVMLDWSFWPVWAEEMVRLSGSLYTWSRQDCLFIPAVLGALVGVVHLVYALIGGHVRSVCGEDQLLRDGLLVLLFRDIRLQVVLAEDKLPDLVEDGGIGVIGGLVHLLQDDVPPAEVVLPVGPLLPRAVVDLAAAAAGLLRVVVHGATLVALVPGDVDHAVGAVQGRVVGDAGETGALGQVQIPHVLAEIVLGGGLDAVAPVAQKDLVQVEFQDLVLVVLLFRLQGGEDLQDLASDGHVVVLGIVLDGLLGDGGGAEGVPHGQEHIHERAGGAVPVHPVVVPEPLVLDGDEGVDQILRDLLVLHVLPVLVAVEGEPLHLRSGLRVDVVHHRVLVHGEDGEVDIRPGHDGGLYIDGRVDDHEDAGHRADQHQGAQHLQDADEDGDGDGPGDRMPLPVVPAAGAALLIPAAAPVLVLVPFCHNWVPPYMGLAVSHAAGVLPLLAKAG